MTDAATEPPPAPKAKPYPNFARNAAHSAAGVAMVVVFALGVGIFSWAVKSTTAGSVNQNAERVAASWAAFFLSQFDDLAAVIETGAWSKEIETKIGRMTTAGDVFRFKLFDGDGRLVLISDEGLNATEFAERNPEAFEALTTGKPVTIVESGVDDPNRPDVYVETYMPVIKDGRTIAVVEVYVDQTADSALIHARKFVFGAKVSLALILCICPIFFALLAARRSLQRKNADLIEARERAEDGERAKSEFLANMSHEIRTPMNGVVGMAELLADTEMNGRQKMFSEVILTSARSLLTIINDILDFSKIDAGHLRIEEAPFTLADAVAGPAQLLAPTAFGKGLELMIRVDPRLPAEAVGDFGRIRQIVTNLLGNAVKFTTSGDVVLSLTTAEPQAAFPPGAPFRLRIEVRDTGPGVPPQKLDMIFDKFTQIDGSATRAFEGTGLGLAITKGLVDLMGGSIHVQSTPGVGSVFWVELPLLAASCAGAGAPDVTNLRGRRALVVDDNRTNRLILNELIASWGMKGETAETAAKGFNALKHAASLGSPYDILLLDHHMPEQSGAEMLAALRADEDLADTPTIILSSMDQFEVFEADAAARPDAALTKPIAGAALRVEVARVLDGAEPMKQPRSPRGETPARETPAPPSSGSLADASAKTAGAAARDDGPASLPAADANATPACGGVEILLIEDNHVNQIVVQEMLRLIDLGATVANDGRRGVDAFIDLSPRLVLMDVSMPVMNGYEASAAIRAHEAATGAKPCTIVGMTAHAMEGDRDRCIKAGMDDYMSKPISADALHAMIAQLGMTPGKKGRDGAAA